MKKLIFDGITVAMGLVFAIACFTTIITDGAVMGNTAWFSGLMLFALLFIRPKIK
jgi:hypothetical protein